MVDGMKFEDIKDSEYVCATCEIGKSHRLPFPSSKTTTSRILELVHSDLLGPIETKSLGGARYVLLFLDDFSHKSFVYFLESKQETVKQFEIFKKYTENQMNCKIKTIRTDNGGEYCNTAFKNITEDSGILHQTTCAYTSQQNGKAERYFRSLMDKARCLLFEARLPNEFWAEAVNTATYLLNNSPSKCVESTPEEIWSGKKPNLAHLKVYGCKAFAHVPAQKRKKLDPRATPCIFVGYSLKSKGYRLFDPRKSSVFISRDVIFSENETGSTLLQNSCENNNQPFYIMPDETLNAEDDVGSAGSESDQNSDTQSVHSDVTDAAVPVLRRSQRVRRAPAALDDYVVYSAMVSDENDPLTVEEAMDRTDADLWKEAMNQEMKSLEDNGTWELVDLPPSRKPLQCKWVFRTKRDASGKIAKYKARLVVKGFAQKKGLDFDETFSPVVRYSSIRYLLALAAELDLDIDQMDAVSAFLQGDLKSYTCFSHQASVGPIRYVVCIV